VKEVRCAIYTRKSCEEGLEQSFNSLDAQREACEAYILSQKHEGWQVIADQYDDGGFSGGNMERPALKRLLEAIATKRVDTVVVYKVDRLTRSLADFARIVESFDSKGVSFVSVTQQFNTTTSMGRLTLNVLLSFAQFEREVTGERIRDKIAASRKKGMWMGGNVPLGYDLQDHQLVINPAEAEQVRQIFEQYLRFDSFHELWQHLERIGIRSKQRTWAKRRSGVGLSRGNLYYLLNNPVYISKVRHKGQVYPGQHPAILSIDLWTKVSEKLKEKRVKRVRSSNLSSGRLLTGLLVDDKDARFSPNYASKKGRRYDYYVCRKEEGIRRLPAIETERIVASALRSLLLNSLDLSKYFAGLDLREMRLLIAAAGHAAEQLSDPTSPEAKRLLKACLRRVVITESDMNIDIDRNTLQQRLLGQSTAAAPDGPTIPLAVPFERKHRGSQVRLVLTNGEPTESVPIPSLARSVALARDWADQIISGRARTLDDLSAISGMDRCYIGKILQCSALSPSAIEAILEGRHAVDLTIEKLTERLDMDWSAQALQRSLTS